jgi:hypothetical protein
MKDSKELLLCMAAEVLFECLHECDTGKLNSKKIMDIAKKVVSGGPMDAIEFILSLSTFINCVANYVVKYDRGNMYLFTDLCGSLTQAIPKEDLDMPDSTRDFFHKHKQ